MNFSTLFILWAIVAFVPLIVLAGGAAVWAKKRGVLRAAADAAETAAKQDVANVASKITK